MRRRALLSSVAAALTVGVVGCLSVGGGCSRGRTVIFTPVDADDVADREAAPATEDRPELFAARERDRGFESRPFVVAYLDPDDQDDSHLTAGVEESYLGAGGGHFAIDDLDEGTTSARRLAYAADHVAGDTAAFAEMIFDERGMVLDSPPEEVEQLLLTVREEDDRLEICDDDPGDEGEADPNQEAANALQAYLSELESGVSGDLEYVRYEGEWYRIGISGWDV